MIVITGSYTGNGADNRNIVTSPAVTPSVVFLKGKDSGGFDGWVRMNSMTGDQALAFTGAQFFTANIIQGFNSDGFQVGSSTNANGNLFTYRYCALYDNGQQDLAVGTYTGTGADNRNIVISPAFQPEIVFIMPDDGSSYVSLRGGTAHNPDDFSCRINGPQADGADYIQQFNSDGFQVGVANNLNTVHYYYFALKGNANGVASGLFVGDSTDNRDITVGFQAQMVFVKTANASNEVAYRFGSDVGDSSYVGELDATTDIIQSIGATTFQVGTNGAANLSPVTMRWFAFTSTSASSDANFNRTARGVLRGVLRGGR